MGIKRKTWRRIFVLNPFTFLVFFIAVWSQNPVGYLAPTSQQQPKFLLTRNLSQYSCSAWNLSAASYLTHNKMENSYHEQDFVWSAPATSLATPLLTLLHPPLQPLWSPCSSLNTARTLLFQGLGRYFSSAGEVFSSIAKTLLLIFKNLFKWYSFRKAYPCSTLKEKATSDLLPHALIHQTKLYFFLTLIITWRYIHIYMYSYIHARI